MCAIRSRQLETKTASLQDELQWGAFWTGANGDQKRRFRQIVTHKCKLAFQIVGLNVPICEAPNFV